MKILVTGAGGLLGAHLVASLSRRHDLVGVDRHPWWGDEPAQWVSADLEEPGLLERTVRAVSPEAVIHCAAMVHVDACERDRASAYVANVVITRNLLRAVPPGCLFVYLSTDGIFKGDSSFCVEEELPCPRTVYGRTKLEGEWEVQLASPDYLIVRTNFYGWSSGRKRTSAEWLYEALEEGRPITLFEDFFFSPIYVADFVERLQTLIEGGHRGVFHLAGKERVSKSQFGERMAHLADFSMDRVRRGSIDEAHLLAPRPKDMSLDSSRFTRVTGLDLPDCVTGLRRFLQDRGLPLSRRFQRTCLEASK